MSVDLEAFKNAAYNWIVEELEGTEISRNKVIWIEPSAQNHNAPRPSRPYVGMKILSGPTKVGHDIVKEIEPDVFAVQGNRELTLTVSFYGLESLSLADQLASSVDKPSRVLKFQEKNIAVIAAPTIIDATIPTESGFEVRRTLDVRFRVVSIVEDRELQTIESVEVTNENNGEDFLVENP